MICETAYFSGLADCKKLFDKVVGIGVTVKGTTFTRATFTTEATWHTGIASATTASRTTTMFKFLNYERTTDDPSVQTSNLGIKRKDLDPAPSMMGWLDISMCDYKTLFALEDISLDIVLFLADGTQFGSLKSDGTVKGLRATISLRKDLPPSDNNMASYPVDIYFDSVQEFENFYVDKPDYTFSDLLDFVPVGLDVYIVTDYAAGDVVVKVLKRCTGTGLTGLAAADFEILESNATATVIVSAIADNGLGQYTVTVQKNSPASPANLASGDWYKMQVSDDDATYNTYQSNVLKETV